MYFRTLLSLNYVNDLKATDRNSSGLLPSFMFLFRLLYGSLYLRPNMGLNSKLQTLDFLSVTWKSCPLESWPLLFTFVAAWLVGQKKWWMQANNDFYLVQHTYNKKDLYLQLPSLLKEIAICKQCIEALLEQNHSTR